MFEIFKRKNNNGYPVHKPTSFVSSNAAVFAYEDLHIALGRAEGTGKLPAFGFMAATPARGFAQVVSIVGLGGSISPNISGPLAPLSNGFDRAPNATADTRRQY